MPRTQSVLWTELSAPSLRSRSGPGEEWGKSQLGGRKGEVRRRWGREGNGRGRGGTGWDLYFDSITLAAGSAVQSAAQEQETLSQRAGRSPEA